MNYDSFLVRNSGEAVGVSFILHRVSFGRRMELTRHIREMAQKAECLAAGSDPVEKMDAALLASEIDRTYVLWGLKEIRGLTIDGAPATPEALIDSGPEDLFREVLVAVKAECGLTETERKN